MSEILKVTLSDFIEGKLGNNWPAYLGEIEPYIEYYKYLIDKDTFKTDEKLSYVAHNNIIIDTVGYVLSGSYVTYSVLNLDTPKVPFLISDENSSFNPKQLTQIDSPYVFNAPFAFCKPVLGTDYIDTLTGKKKWKFKKSINDEGKILIKEVESYDQDFIKLIKNKTCEKFPDYVDPQLASLLFLKAYKTCKVKWYKLYKLDKLCAVSAVIETSPNIWYCAIFMSIEPCVYSFTRFFVNQLTIKDVYHYGASFSFDPEVQSVYTYKSNVSNSVSYTPYIVIADEDDITPYSPPYFSKLKNEWVMA